MSWIQRFFQKHFPEAAKSMEEESRQWILQCSSCGKEQSYWDIGGIRWGASSKGKKVWLRCRNCHNFVGHRVYRKKPTLDASTPSAEATANSTTLSS